jgi:CheY-like chemotaxis protein
MPIDFPSIHGSSDFSEFLTDYFVECDEHLSIARRSLLALEPQLHEAQTDRELLDELFRSFHSLKGLSAMVGFKDERERLAVSRMSTTVTRPIRPGWIDGDCIRLAQILSNLIQNASKFTNRGGEVRVKAEKNSAKKEFVIRVEDTGIGMSPDVVLKVFEAFSQAESSLARSKGGLGLGLALVKGLAELHDGDVGAHSDGINKGSVFTVRLPIMEAEPHQAVDKNVFEEPRNFKRVLIIEDNRDTAITMKMLIRHLGLEAEIAPNGTQGIAVAKSYRPDVILCDIGLPGMDGFAVARALRSDEATRDVYLVAQSGYGQADDIRKSSDAGFDSHLTKPIDFSELERLLKGTRAVAGN